ncbi:4503_t:CDS:1, partial [Gigaspora rosea]
DICKSLGLATEGVKTDLIQRLKAYSNTITPRTENSNSQDMGENEDCMENTNGVDDQNIIDLETRGESIGLRTLRELAQQTRGKNAGEPSGVVHQNLTNQQGSAMNLPIQELNDQLRKGATKTNKRRLQEDNNDE